jgi:hypothetical protein
MKLSFNIEKYVWLYMSYKNFSADSRGINMFRGYRELKMEGEMLLGEKELISYEIIPLFLCDWIMVGTLLL